ncbi:MAG TPA: nucleotidyltransferase [Firmicutes bacterium]|nr:nucleotidyltransferase [Bacillota bacterium]
MKATGLIVEYNPFHNGHLFHLKESKAQSNADIIIVVMSGHFTQRGEPTVISKWDRTKMALLNGADLVIELPYLYSCQSADLFATGSVSILTHLKVKELIFGSESGNIVELQKLEALTSTQDFQNKLKTFLNLGYSLPNATKKALDTSGIPTDLATLPNNTLGLYYMRAIKSLNSEIIPNTITRIHSGYHDALPSHQSIASATSVRHLRESAQLYTDYVPETVAELLEQHVKTTNTYHNWESYFPILKQKILTLTPTYLVQIHDVEEGIEHRLFTGMLQASSYAQFMDYVKTKRYTTTRIQRICANILTHTTKQFITDSNLHQGAPYIRILGATPNGRAYLKSIKKDITVPIYSKFDQQAHPLLKHEQSVTAAYSSILPEPHCTTLNKKEYTQFPIMIDV